MLTESTIVATITSVGNVIGIVLAAVLANSARRHARAARTQVENGHSTNLRDDIDGIRADLRGFRLDVGRNSDRLGEHDKQIERLWARSHPLIIQKEAPMNITAPRTTDETGTPTARPQPKVIAATTGATIGAAATTIGVYVFETATSIDLPVSIESAALVLNTAAVGFLAGYIKRPNDKAS